jgi:hypothetical protein
MEGACAKKYEDSTSAKREVRYSAIHRPTLVAFLLSIS